MTNFKLRLFGRGGIAPDSRLAATGLSDSRTVVLYALSLSFTSLTASCLTFVATLSLSLNSRIKHLPDHDRGRFFSDAPVDVNSDTFSSL